MLLLSKLKDQVHQDYYLFHRFKMMLYDSPVRRACLGEDVWDEGNVCILSVCTQSSQPIL